MSEPTENSEIAEIPEPVVEAQPEPAEPADPPAEEKRGRGRPAGAKDRVKRTVKPKVRIEPIPAPAEPPAEPAEPSQPSQPQPQPPLPPEPEPPSPRTMYRQTSEQLLHLRTLMQDNRRATAAAQYTQKLSMWPVV